MKVQKSHEDLNDYSGKVRYLNVGKCFGDEYGFVDLRYIPYQLFIGKPDTSKDDILNIRYRSLV